MDFLKTPLGIATYIIELIGCISFATSGAITAIRKRADILGVWILSLIEIFGGGLIRDIIISKGAPHIFWDSEYLLLALVSLVISTIWFIIAYIPKTASFIEKHRHDKWIYILDAIGIAVFCACGIKVAMEYPPENASTIGQYVYFITLGVITGVGGGMFRDVFIGEIPAVFKKHFYMTPCIIGSIIYTILDRNGINEIWSLTICISVIVGLRILAMYFKWNLPQAKGYNTLVDKEKSQNNNSSN